MNTFWFHPKVRDDLRIAAVARDAFSGSRPAALGSVTMAVAALFEAGVSLARAAQMSLVELDVAIGDPEITTPAFLRAFRAHILDSESNGRDLFREDAP
jgi:hypothetical protein